ncbi:MAG: class F sortase [Dehalococcoidia bacterium]|nr:MAG: class F sortase [Dehalococcoidia bacterium]
MLTSRGLVRGLTRAVSGAIEWLRRDGRRSLRWWPLLALSVLLAATLTSCSNKDKNAVRLLTPTPTSAGASATPTPSHPDEAAPPLPTPKVTPPPDANKLFRNLDDFLKEYDYPKDANFARIKIPAISVDARVASRTVGRDGIMADPAGPADVIWYDLSGWPGLGGKPGEGGNAIFSGHVDYDYLIPYAGVRYRGQGVFSKISALSTGDLIEVEYGGKVLRYQVVSRRQYNAGSGVDWTTVWSGKVPKDTITLYTCGGAFDTITKEYSDRVVVRAERVP